MEINDPLLLVDAVHHLALRFCVQ